MSKKSEEKKSNTTFAGILFLGLAIIVLFGDKISPEAQGFILFFFIGAGYLLEHQPDETKRIAKAIADVIIAVVEALKKIILGILKTRRTDARST